MHSPYFTWQISPTTSSPTGICWAFPLRITANLCSCSILLCRPRNCLSFFQSLNAVTKTTITTAPNMAVPSIHPACPSDSSPIKLQTQFETRTLANWVSMGQRDITCFLRSLSAQRIGLKLTPICFPYSIYTSVLTLGLMEGSVVAPVIDILVSIGL